MDATVAQARVPAQWTYPGGILQRLIHILSVSHVEAVTAEDTLMERDALIILKEQQSIANHIDANLGLAYLQKWTVGPLTANKNEACNSSLLGLNPSH